MVNGAGTSLTNDILGNRTGLGSSVTYGWDCTNRMTSFNGGTATSYAYRADGMRVTRTQGSNTDRFRYDAQMPVETAQTIGATQTIENGLGARGIDISATITGSGTIVSFPLYDAHGNQVETISRSGANYSYANQRSFGAWGEVRQGATSGGPKGRYCGNLGHVQDDESSLVYMRARYYEPTSGRFTDEDPAHHGPNWFTYCSNSPVNRMDGSGRADYDEFNPSEWISGVLIALRYFQSGGITALQLEDEIIKACRAMSQIAKGCRLIGQDMMADAEIMDQTAAGQGDLGVVTLQLGELEQAAGAMTLAEGPVAQLSMRWMEIALNIISMDQ